MMPVCRSATMLCDVARVRRVECHGRASGAWNMARVKGRLGDIVPGSSAPLTLPACVQIVYPSCLARMSR